MFDSNYNKKKLFMKKIALRLVLVVCSVATFVSCESDQDETLNNENVEVEFSRGDISPITVTSTVVDPNDAEVQGIVADGWPIESITRAGNGSYIVGGDMVYPKNFDSNDTRQATTEFLVNRNNSTFIRVFIDPVLTRRGPDNWEAEITEAMNIWTNVNQSNLRFVRTFDTNVADIFIFSDAFDFATGPGFLPNGQIASGEFPFFGSAGPEININLDYESNRTVTSSQKLNNMVHEFGHTIGFRHTNWLERGESRAFQVFGTPQVDRNSVMNGGTANNSFRGLTRNDRRAIQTFY